jgi:hypothetical protein
VPANGNRHLFNTMALRPDSLVLRVVVLIPPNPRYYYYNKSTTHDETILSPRKDNIKCKKEKKHKEIGLNTIRPTT